jgi:hypothetical protein
VIKENSDIEILIARRLWKVFQFHLPDTPNRVARAVLKELDDNGYSITKRRIKMATGSKK